MSTEPPFIVVEDNTAATTMITIVVTAGRFMVSEFGSNAGPRYQTTDVEAATADCARRLRAAAEHDRGEEAK